MANQSEKADLDGDGIPDDIDLDIDGDEVSNDAENSVGTDPYKADTDGDGTKDLTDECPLDANTSVKIEFFQDTDGDGYGDFNTTTKGAFCPDDPSIDPAWVSNNSDLFPNDATEHIDSDGDGVGDSADVFPFDSSEWLDNDFDGVGSNADFDDNDPSVGVISPLIFYMSIPSDSFSFTLPLDSGFEYNFRAVWGDGEESIISSDTDPNATHVYAQAGSYKVEMWGLVERIDFYSSPHRNLFTRLESFGAVGLKDLNNSFYLCNQLSFVGDGDLSFVTNAESMFRFTSPYVETKNWNLQRLENAHRMMQGVRGSIDTSQWVTSNITDMTEMFQNTHAKTIDTGSWDISNVQSLRYAFGDNKYFNPDTTNWNTSNVTDISYAFNNNDTSTADVSQWNVANVTDATYFFANGKSSEVNLSDWNVSNLQSMERAFSRNNSITVNLDNWNLSNVTNANFVFQTWMDQDISFSSPPIHPFFIGFNQSVDISALDFNHPTFYDSGGRFLLYDSADLSPGHTSQMFLKLVDPAEGIDTTVSGSAIYLRMGCRGAFDIATALDNLTDNGAPPNNFNTWSGYRFVCEDIDGDQIENRDDPDLDGDGTPNELDSDMDGDGIANAVEKTNGTKENFGDSDGDGTDDSLDAFPMNPYMSIDGDGDGIGLPYDINDASADPTVPFITIWQTTSAGETVVLPIVDDPALSANINWGDTNTSIVTTGNLAGATHSYASAGTYVVKITGTLPTWSFASIATSKDNLLAVPLLGEVGFQNLSGAFNLCRNLTFVGHGDLSSVTDMSSMFEVASSQLLTIDSKFWDVSSVTDASRLFYSVFVTEIDVSTWNTSNFQNIDETFYDWGNLPLDLRAWDVSNVTSMDSLFHHAYKSSINVSGWNTSNVADMDEVFYDFHFGKLWASGWDTSNVTTMDGVFGTFQGRIQDNISFNTSNVQSLWYAFDYMYAVEMDISNWDVSNVTQMGGIFASSNLKGVDLNKWDTSNVQDLAWAFSGSSNLETDLGGWNVANVTTMQSIFDETTGNTLDLSNWNTLSLQNLTINDPSFMTNSFEQWDLSNLTNLTFWWKFDSKLINFKNMNLNTAATFTDLRYLSVDSLVTFLQHVHSVNPAHIAPIMAANPNLTYCISPPSMDVSSIIPGAYTGTPIHCIDEDSDGFGRLLDPNDGNASMIP